MSAIKVDEFIEDVFRHLADGCERWVIFELEGEMRKSLKKGLGEAIRKALKKRGIE